MEQHLSLMYAVLTQQNRWISLVWFIVLTAFSERMVTNDKSNGLQKSTVREGGGLIWCAKMLVKLSWRLIIYTKFNIYITIIILS